MSQYNVCDSYEQIKTARVKLTFVDGATGGALFITGSATVPCVAGAMAEHTVLQREGFLAKITFERSLT